MFGDDAHARGFWLTLGMGRTTGVDLAGAVVQGWLTRAELGRMVGVCRNCALDSACVSWLGRQSAAAARPPAWCPNGPAIAALAPDRP